MVMGVIIDESVILVVIRRGPRLEGCGETGSGKCKEWKREYIKIPEVWIVRRRPVPVKRVRGRSPDRSEREIGKGCGIRISRKR